MSCGAGCIRSIADVELRKRAPQRRNSLEELTYRYYEVPNYCTLPRYLAQKGGGTTKQMVAFAT